MNYLNHFNKHLVILGIVLCNSITSSWAIDEGKPAPSIEGKLINGMSVKLNKTDKSVVIVNFWASWCAPCRQEMPALEAYYQQHKAQGLRVLAISMDDPTDDDKVRAVMRSYSFPAAFNRDVDYSGYGRIWRMPMTFVIDSKGILRKDGSVGDPKIDLPTLEKVVTPFTNKRSEQPAIES